MEHVKSFDECADEDVDTSTQDDAQDGEFVEDGNQGLIFDTWPVIVWTFTWDEQHTMMMLTETLMTALTSALFRLAALIWLVTPVTVLSTWERAVLASTINDEAHDQQ